MFIRAVLIVSLNEWEEQIQKKLDDVQRKQQQIYARIQENEITFDKEWNRWTTPNKIKRSTQEKKH